MATILIVDDEEPVRDFLAQVFSQAGHRSIQAIHGAQALEIFAKERPDLVLSDVMMPVLNGGELCRQIKSSEHGRSIPVILMSSAGEFPGQCYQLCGYSHANMRERAIIQPQVDFDAWLTAGFPPNLASTRCRVPL